MDRGAVVALVEPDDQLPVGGYVVTNLTAGYKPLELPASQCFIASEALAQLGGYRRSKCSSSSLSDSRFTQRQPSACRTATCCSPS